MKICITGIAGFIGAQLARHLVHDGHTVTGIDNLDWGYEDDVPEECVWKCADLLYLSWPMHHNGLRKEERDAVFGDVDVLIHCAASLEVMYSLKEPTSDLRTNTEGTVQVLETMKEYNIKHMINFSSACVYGAGAEIMLPTREDDVRLNSPHWPYGASKLAAEIYCNLYNRMYGFNIIHLRPGIVCGPQEWYGRALTIALKRALEGQPIVVFTDQHYEVMSLAFGGDGTPRRDFVHINDVVSLVRKCLQGYPNRFSGVKVYNAGSHNQHSIMEMAKKVGEMLDAKVITEELPEGGESEYVKGRVRIPGEMRGMLLDMNKAANELGHISIQSTLTRIIDDEVTWLKAGGLERWKEASMKV